MRKGTEEFLVKGVFFFLKLRVAIGMIAVAMLCCSGMSGGWGKPL